MKPLPKVGTPRHRDARSRCESMVSRTTRHASRRTLRIFRSPWVDSGGHFFGWPNQALVLSAARYRMRGRPPLPLRMGRTGSSRGFLDHDRNGSPRVERREQGPRAGRQCQVTAAAPQENSGKNLLPGTVLGPARFMKKIMGCMQSKSCMQPIAFLSGASVGN